MKQAKIKCTHCGTEIIVREKTVSAANAEKIFAAADRMFKDMDKHFARIFHPSLWK